MTWIFPSARDGDNAALGKRLRGAAGPFRADRGPSFPCFGEVRFADQRARCKNASATVCLGNGGDESAACLAEGDLYPPAETRSDHQLYRPQAVDIGSKSKATPPAQLIPCRSSATLPDLR